MSAGKKEQIREKLRRIASEGGPRVTLLAQVKSVDVDELTCVLYDELEDDETFDYNDVRLSHVLDGKNSILLIPKVDTWVLAVRIEDDEEWCVISVEEVESILITAAGFTIYMDEEGIQLNGNSLGGLIKIEELVSKINTIEGSINDLKQVFSAWVPSPNDGGAALKGGAATWFGATITETVVSDLENENVKHG